MREPGDAERRASSAVWLEGTIAEPPQVSRHPELPSIQLAGMILRVTYARPTDFPGLGSDDHRDRRRQRLYPDQPPGRREVVPPGQCRARDRTAGLPRWNTRAAQRSEPSWKRSIASGPNVRLSCAEKPGELRKAEGAYRRTRQRFESAARLFVLAGHVELLAGDLELVVAPSMAIVDAHGTFEDSSTRSGLLTQSLTVGPT